MRRWIGVVVVVGFVSAACAAGTTPSTSEPTDTAPDSSETTAALPADTVTTGTGTDWPPVAVLVTNEDGVFQIDSHGVITQLVKGHVAYAIDDTRGGLLFQVERGRSPAWWGQGSHVQDTRVWWLPKASTEARELLVPTPGEAYDLTLHDSFVGVDGHLGVVYVRHDSTMDPVAGFFTFVDSLRTFDADTGAVTELATHSGYEAGIGHASASASAVLVELLDQVGLQCRLFDLVSGEEIGVRGVPDSSGCEGLDCPWSCVLSGDGDWLAHEDSTPSTARVTAFPLATPDASKTYPLGGESIWDLDLGSNHLLVNHSLDWSGRDQEASLIDLDTGDRTRVPVAGLARFVSAPVNIDGPVMAPEPAAIGLRLEGSWRRVELPGAKSVTDVAPVGAGFFAIGTDADGLAGWITQIGLNWSRVDVVEPSDAGRCHAWRVYTTGSGLIADVRCQPSEESSNTIPRPMVSWNGWQWNEGRGPLSTVEIEPGAWRATGIRHIASDGEILLLFGWPGVGFDWSVFLPRYVAASVLDRMADSEGWASLTHADDGTGMVVIQSSGEVIFEVRLDELGVTGALLEASRRTEPHLWRSGPNLTFQDLGTIDDLAPREFDELVGTPSGFYALDNWWSHETGQVLDIWRSHDGSHWRLVPQPEIDFPGDVAGLERYQGGILIEGHRANAHPIEPLSFSPSTGWTSIPLPEREDLCHRANATAVGSSGLIAGWSDTCDPGPHATQSPAHITEGDATLRVDRMPGVGAPLLQISSNATGRVLLEVFDLNDGSIAIDGDTVRFTNLDTGETVLSMLVDDLLDGVCFDAPKTLWWSLSDGTGRWEPHPDIAGSRLVASNQHLIVAVDQEPERDMCQPLTDAFPELFPDPEPKAWIGWVD